MTTTTTLPANRSNHLFVLHDVAEVPPQETFSDKVEAKIRSSLHKASKTAKQAAKKANVAATKAAQKTHGAATKAATVAAHKTTKLAHSTTKLAKKSTSKLQTTVLGRPPQHRQVMEKVHVVSAPDLEYDQGHEAVYPYEVKPPSVKTKKKISSLVDSFKRQHSSFPSSPARSTATETSHSSAESDDFPSPPSRLPSHLRSRKPPKLRQRKLSRHLVEISAHKPKDRDVDIIEAQFLKASGAPDALDALQKELFRIRTDVGVTVGIAKITLPSVQHAERIQKLEERDRREHEDWLDKFFTDQIPYLHDYLVAGTPRTDFYRILGRPRDIDLLHKLCQQVLVNQSLDCDLSILDHRVKSPLRKKFEAGSKASAKSASDRDLLDSVFTDDFSTWNPFFEDLCGPVH